MPPPTFASGEDLEEHCRQKGLCPLCTTTKTRKRVFAFSFRKPKRNSKWEALTIAGAEEGTYVVYKGYCLKPGCFTLDQAKRLNGEDTTTSSKQESNVSSARRPPARRNSNGTSTLVVPDRHLLQDKSQTTPVSDYQPLGVVATTYDALMQSSSSNIGTVDLTRVSLRPLEVELLASALHKNSSVTALILESCSLDDDKIKVLTTQGLLLMGGGSLALKKLYLRFNRLGNEGMDHLSRYLEATKTLEKLDLSRNRIGSEGGIAVFNSFCRNPTKNILTCLNLSNNDLFDLDQGSFGMSSFLQSNSSLRVLNLEGNHLHDGVAMALSKAIMSNPQPCRMERLYLGWNSIGDEGCLALADWLASPSHSASLKVLGLAENEIGNTGARALLRAMDDNTTIKEISGLWRNRIDRRFIIVAIRRLLLTHQNNNNDTSSNRSSLKLSTRDLMPSEQAPVVVPVPSVPVPKDEAAVVAEPPLVEAKCDRDRLTVFQSSPLAYFDRDRSTHVSIPLYDVDFETEVIRTALEEATGGTVEVNVETATNDRLSAYFANSDNRVVHISTHGDPAFIGLENGYGSLQKLPLDGVRRLLAAVGCHVHVVVLSSHFAKDIGQAFVDAGVPHVICCHREMTFRDNVANIFLEAFYESASQKHANLDECFARAMQGVLQAPQCHKIRNLHKRFALLPEGGSHSVPVFFTHPVPEGDDNGAKADPESKQMVPLLPENFIGREIDVFEIVESLKVDEIIRVGGTRDVGRSSVVSAACTYVMKRRELFEIDHIFWLPPTPQTPAEEDTLYGDLCAAVRRMMFEGGELWNDETFMECIERIEVELESARSVFVIDDRDFSDRAVQENLERFISHFLNLSNTKIVLISSRSSDEYSTLSGDTQTSFGGEDAIDIAPLGIKSTALLFASSSRYIASRGVPVAHSAHEFAELVEPEYITNLPDIALKSSKRREELFSRMGSGKPSKIIEAAETMGKEDFIELINIANRPEAYVESLAGVEQALERRSAQKSKAIKEQNFLRAMDLEVIVEEMETMKSMFPSMEDMRASEAKMKSDLANAVQSKQYTYANDLKKDLLDLKKQLMKEQSVLMRNNQAGPAKQLDSFQAQVQSMLSKSHTDEIPCESVEFLLRWGERECTVEICNDTLENYSHPSQTTGVVCWTNECCDLTASSQGEALLKEGSPDLEEEIDSLPILTSTPWGDVKCSTGNAVVVGPDVFGDLDSPCVILAVGPLSPSNWEDIDDEDRDTQEYTKRMLRSSYRSSMVLIRHSELDAVALSMLTTRSGGDAFDATLAIGLSTLGEELPFTQLKHVRIMTSSNEMVAKFATVALSMGWKKAQNDITA